MDRLVINPDEAQLIRDAHAPFIGDVTSREDSLLAIRETSAASLPNRLLTALSALSNSQCASGCLLIQRLADESLLPATPRQPSAAPNDKLTLLCEVVELGVALQLGEPVAYRAEKEGALIQHVFPVQSEQLAPSNESSALTLDLHTELVFSRRNPHRPLDVDSPDFILLLCLRSDPTRDAMTLVAEIEALCARTPYAHQTVLRQSRFELRAPYSFTRDDPSTRPWVGPVPILGQDQTQPTAAFDFACGARGIDAEAQVALDALKAAAASADVTCGLGLEAGDLLILDNRRCAHGRTPFVATYDGTDRWMQRAYVRRSLSGMQPIDPDQSPRVF